MQREILSGKFFVILGGWFKFTLIYSGIYGHAMGSFDDTEVCELVGLYNLYILSTKYWKKLGKNGMYRDDGLACFQNVSGPQADRIRKGFLNISRKEFQLSIVCETNLKIVNC